MLEASLAMHMRSVETRIRMGIVATLVLAVTSAHWWTPQGADALHIAHVVLRKLYVLPIVLAATWFDLRSALITAGAVTLLYVPHVVAQWGGMPAENINQMGELVTIWITAVLAGVFVDREKVTLRRLAGAYEGTVRALITALDAREHNTEVHSLRVRAYTIRLAQELRVPREKRSVYALAALLHDIGKIGVPDAILLKPGSLTEEEWRCIKEHPSLGRRILAPVSFLREAADIVYTHHEKFDGSGYPQGLAGEKIPHGARLFAVADVFDALTSTRSYKKSMSILEAQSEIAKQSASHFDPDVVKAFLHVPPEEWDQIRETVETSGAGRDAR